MVGLLEQVRLYDEEQAWLRQFVIPEERRDQLTSALGRGEYRWFLADNVFPLEKVRLGRPVLSGPCPATRRCVAALAVDNLCTAGPVARGGGRCNLKANRIPDR